MKWCDRDAPQKGHCFDSLLPFNQREWTFVDVGMPFTKLLERVRFLAIHCVVDVGAICVYTQRNDVVRRLRLLLSVIYLFAARLVCSCRYQVCCALEDVTVGL